MRFRIATICSGNICRSPAAAAVLRAKLSAAGLAEAVSVDSFGTGSWHVGQSIDPRAAVALRERGYDVPAHVAREVDVGDLAERDLILVADHDHLAELLDLTGGSSDTVRLLRSFDPRLSGLAVGDPRLDVADPYYGGAAGFRAMLADIEAAADGVVAHLRQRLRPAS